MLFQFSGLNCSSGISPIVRNDDVNAEDRRFEPPCPITGLRLKGLGDGAERLIASKP